jgi:hypothetical protein
MLNRPKFTNQYDFSGGINIATPGYLIEDNELYADPLNYTGTYNVVWDTGLKKRKGSLKINSVPVSDKIVDGRRYYRELAPERTTIVIGRSEGMNRRIMFLNDSNALSTIKTLSDGTLSSLTQFREAIYVASGTEYVQKITHDGNDFVASDVVGTNNIPSVVVAHRDRLWVAGGTMPEGQLECSAYDSDTDWAGGEGELFNVGFGDGDPIVNLVPLGDDLVIYKNDSIYVMKGDNLFNWFNKKEENAIGCAAPKSVADVGYGHIFLSNDNVYFFTGQDLLPVGNKIKPWLDNIPQAFRKYAVGTYHNGYYRLSFASAYSTGENDIEMLLDVKLLPQQRNSWWMFKGRTIASYIPYNGAGDDNTLKFGSGDAGYLYDIEGSDSDDGTAIELSIHTKYFTFDSPNSEKNFDRIKVDHSLAIGDYELSIIKNLNDEYILPLTLSSDTSNTATFGTAVLGTTLYSSKSKARMTREVALPSELDGYSISYLIKHDEIVDNVIFFGFSLVFKYKAF